MGFVRLRLSRAATCLAVLVILLPLIPMSALRATAAGPTYTVTATIPVSGNPSAVAVDPNTDVVYVATPDVTSPFSGSVSVIDGVTNTVSATIPVSGPDWVAIDPSTDTVYVTSQVNSTVLVINGATNAVTATIAVGSGPAGIAVDPATHTIYVADEGNGTVSVIDGVTNTVTAIITVGTGPQGVAVDPTTHIVYVADEGGTTVGDTVSVIDGATNTVTTTITVGDAPYSVAVNPVTDTVYVASGTSPGNPTMSVIDGATNTVTATMPMNMLGQVAVDPATDTVYMTAVDPAASLFTAVLVIDGATNTITATVQVGDAAGALAVNPVTHAIYVTDSPNLDANNTVWVISPSNISGPQVTGIAPSSGLMSGGTSVTITGTDLTAATSVSFGNTPATSYTVDADSQITATSPEHAAGMVDVTVTTPNGTSATSSADEFTYSASSSNPPVIFIPGILGSELVATQSGAAHLTTSTGQSMTVTYNAGDAIWPNYGNILNPTANHEYYDLLRFGDNGKPLVSGIAPDGNLVTLGGYSNTESFFTHHGYTENQNFFVFTYDWRYGAERQIGAWHEGDELVSGSLDRLIQDAMAITGSAEVDIVAHSMGTLVARSYLTSGAHRADVAHAILLGSPNIGTPLGSWQAIQGECQKVLGFCAISAQEMQYISRSLPGELELAVSQPYCTIYDGSDKDHPDPLNDELIVSPVSGCDALQTLEQGAQASPAGLQEAVNFHSDDLTWLNSVPKGTVSLFVGTGQCTIGQVRESNSFQLSTLSEIPTYDYAEIDGDGTVVRQSASFGDGQFANGSPIYYRSTDHLGLANDTSVLQDVLAILDGQHPSPGSAESSWVCWGVSVHSPMELQVTDSSGRVLGGANADALSYQNVDGSYNRFGDMKATTLDIAGKYTVSVFGTASGEGTIRLRTITQDGITQEIIYPHVPTSPTSTGTLTFDAAAGISSDLVVDVKGDGTDVVTIRPTTLTGAAADDETPPSLTLDAPAPGQAVVGSFNLHWTATDTGSGVADSLAVIDAASTKQVVNAPGPITLAPGQHTVDLYAEDQAGNAAHQQPTLGADAYQWLSPLQANGSFTGQAGQTIPVKFTVTTPDGQFVNDASVLVGLVDSQGNVVVPVLQFSQSPSQGVVVQGNQYHANLSTSGLAPGQYSVRVRFNSAQLVGSFTVPVNLK